MNLLKTIFGNALLLATLVVAIAGTVLVAHAGRQPGHAVQPAEPASNVDEGTGPGPVGWMRIPRGSFVDAML